MAAPGSVTQTVISWKRFSASHQNESYCTGRARSIMLHCWRCFVRHLNLCCPVEYTFRALQYVSDQGVLVQRIVTHAFREATRADRDCRK